jgi:hypothetical protein
MTKDSGREQMVNKLNLFVIIFLVSLLAACGQDKAIEEVVLVTVTAVPVSPTSISQSPTLTPTPSATATTIPTPTPPPSATATTTPIPILTPLPTFAPEELETAVADLLANPMNCDVPCWWGAIPGNTTVIEVQQFLALYTFTDLVNDDPAHIEIRLFYDDNQSYFHVRYTFDNEILKIAFSEMGPPLKEILRKYGQPDEVWLRVVSFEGLLVRLNLVYLQKGMSVGYVVDGNIQDGNVIACFTDEETGRVLLLAPNTAISYKDFPTIFEEDRRYLPLEEATGLTTEEFMQQFSDPNQPQCIETPTELWE